VHSKVPLDIRIGEGGVLEGGTATMLCWQSLQSELATATVHGDIASVMFLLEDIGPSMARSDLKTQCLVRYELENSGVKKNEYPI
jgi:hypothetical protein